MADGNGGANYAISYVNNSAGVITPAALTVTAQADTRIYNGTTTSRRRASGKRRYPTMQPERQQHRALTTATLVRARPSLPADW